MPYVPNAKRYDTMQYRRCGRSGLMLPVISLGAWQTFGGYRDGSTAQDCLFRAFDLGITHFDLANNYGTPPGNAETVCGTVFKEMPRDELIIATKAGYTMWNGPYGDWGSKKYLVASLDQSLKRMQLDYVDIFYHHRPDPNTPLEETLHALDLIVRQGKALYVGVSNYSGAQYCDAVRIIERDKLTPITIHQPVYNMLNRHIEANLLDHTERHGTGTIPFCPLAQGLLSDKYLKGVPEGSRAAKVWEGKSRLDAGQLEKIRALNELAKQREQSLAQMALAWILRDPRVTSCLTGASEVWQVEDNVKTVNKLKFSEEELKQIEDILKK